MLEVGQTSSGMPVLGEVGQQRGVLRRPRCRARCARRRAGAARPRPSPGRWSRRRAARCAARRRGPGRSRPGTAPRHADLGAAEPEADQGVGAVLERVRQRVLGGRQAGLAGDVVDPAQHDAEVALGRDPGVLDRPRCTPRSAMPALHRRVRRAGELGVADVLPRPSRGDLVGQQPHVLGRADQVDDGEVDLDEVGEVAEREELAQRVEVARHGAGWRAASSETIRGDADPTWCTWISALGRPATKDVRGSRPGSVSGRRARPLGRSATSAACDQPSMVCPSTCSPSTSTVGVRVDPVLGRRVGGRVDPLLERQVLDARAHGGLGRAGLDGQVDQLVVVGNRPSSAGWFSKSRSWNVLATSGPDASSTTANALAAAGSSRRCRRGSAAGGTRPAPRPRRRPRRAGRGGRPRARRRTGRGSPRRRRPSPARRPRRRAGRMRRAGGRRWPACRSPGW